MPELDSTPDLRPPFPGFDADDEQDHEGPPAGFREGLPKSYRSRHDPHYVEQLTAPADRQPVRLVALARIDAAGLPAEHTVATLAASISELGVIQPLLVRPHDGRFQLIAGRRRFAAARRAGLTEVPCLVHVVDETRASVLAAADNLRTGPGLPWSTLVAPAPEVQADLDPHTTAMMSELQDALSSLQSCLPLLARAASTREQVAIKLLAVESERAAWAIRARRYLAASVPIAHAPISGAALLDQVKRQAGAAIGLRGGTLQVDPVRSTLTLYGDRPLLATAVVGLAHAQFALGELVQNPRVVVRLASQAEGNGIVLTITQPSAVLSEAALAKFFDVNWADRPGGSAAALAILLGRQAATLHRARLDVSSAAGAGTTATFTFDVAAC